jgi:hypothetical protein
MNSGPVVTVSFPPPISLLLSRQTIPPALDPSAYQIVPRKGTIPLKNVASRAIFGGFAALQSEGE